VSANQQSLPQAPIVRNKSEPEVGGSPMAQFVYVNACPVSGPVIQVQTCVAPLADPPVQYSPTRGVNAWTNVSSACDVMVTKYPGSPAKLE